jgi:hypothetical protein
MPVTLYETASWLVVTPDCCCIDEHEVRFVEACIIAPWLLGIPLDSDVRREAAEVFSTSWTVCVGTKKDVCPPVDELVMFAEAKEAAARLSAEELEE